MLHVNRKVFDPTTPAVKAVARRFKLHLRLAREMRRDGYLRDVPMRTDCVSYTTIHSQATRRLTNIRSYYGICEKKLLKLYNAGYIDLDGLNCLKVVGRYVQRHSGNLSITLLCHLAYYEMRPGGSVLPNHLAYGCLGALKTDGKLNPPKYLESYLDAASRGQPEALERVARWMRDLIESVDKPHGWVFYGVRLALVEGSYVLWNRPVPKLRKWSKRRRLAKRLREHPLLQGCVTAVSKSGRKNDYSYVYHRPGKFWDL